MQKGEGLGWSNTGLIAGPERLIFNVARAYREFPGEPHEKTADFFETAEVMAEINRSHSASAEWSSCLAGTGSDRETGFGLAGSLI